MRERVARQGFTFICLAALLLGGALRLQAGWPAAARGSSSRPAAAPGDNPAGLNDVVLNFYHLVDKGRYGEAYDLALETRWQPGADGAPAPAGLTAKEDFVAELDDELGADGMGLNIVAIDVLQVTALPAAERAPARYPELWALRYLPAGQSVETVYQAEVSGTLLGRCSRWDWHRVVLVARLPGGIWKVLLPGKPTPASPHNEEWFLDRKA